MAPVTQADLAADRDGPAYRHVARTIGDRILHGELAVGQSLPSETSLAKSLGVNRSTMREAIRSLEESGLLARRPGGKRLFVTAPGHDDVAVRMKSAMVLGEMSFREVWEAMRCIEPVICAAAARGIGSAELERLEDNVERMRRASQREEDLAVYDFEFHTIIAAASHNRVLQLCREPISQLFYDAYHLLVRRLKVNERLVYAHERILEGLRTRDVALAQEWMDKHIVDFRRGYELAHVDIDQPVAWPPRQQQ